MSDNLTAAERIARAKAILESKPGFVPLGQRGKKAQVIEDDGYAELSLGEAEISHGGYTKTDQDIQVDSVIDSMTIEEAFGKFIPKDWKTGKSAGKGELMMRCPFPDHPDNNPSASYDPRKGAWYCHACGKGGGAIDLAAISMGFYKDPTHLKDVMRGIAESYGFVRVPSAPGQREARYVQAAPAGPPPPGPLKKTVEQMMTGDPQPQVETSNVVQLSAAPSYDATPIETDVDNDFVYPTLDWRSTLDQDTFLHKYMTTLEGGANPAEYDFWNGMAAIGFVLGRETYLEDSSDVFPNLFLCTVGKSGQGKSMAARELKEILWAVTPYEHMDPMNNGVRMLSTPGSEVFMINEFDRRIPDISNPATTLHLPVKGLVDFSELKGLTTRTNSERGGGYSTVLLNFYDCDSRITNGSMTNGEKIAINPFCTLTSTTQLKSIKELLSAKDAASGLINRFIFVMGNSRRKRIGFDDYRPDRDALKQAYQEFYSFWSNNHGPVKLPNDAKTLFNSLWASRGLPHQDADSSDLLARLDLTMKKILLLLTANAKLRAVTPHIVTQAFTILDYLLETYQAIGLRIGITRQNELEQNVLHAVQRWQERHKGQFPSPRDINLSFSKTKKMTAKELRGVLDSLVAVNELQFIPRPAAGNGAGNFADRYRYVN